MNGAIEQHFDRGAARYSSLASAQKHIATRIATRLPDGASRVLDLGCGPGPCARLLRARYPEAELWGVDLSENMLAEARASGLDATWVRADAADLPFPDRSFDLIFSNLMLQWCASPLTVFRELRRVITPEGRVLISTLLPGSLRELERAQLRAGLESRVLEFSSSERLLHWALEAGLRVAWSSEEEVPFFFPEPRSLLHSVSKIGAGATRATDFLGKRAYAALLRDLEEQRTPNGLPLSYRVFSLELVARAED